MKKLNLLALVSITSMAVSGAAFAQATAPAAGAGGPGAGSPHAKMITDKGYTMSNRMQKMNGYTTYWVMKNSKPWHVKVYDDGRMTEHEGDSPSGG